VSFAVPPESYDRFMGVYSVQLAPQLADLAGVEPGRRVRDVGGGPGALSTEHVARHGPAAVSAVDPSETFVAAARERLPGVAVERASAEQLPFPDDSFDAAIAQLVVHFMSDPVAGLAEMGRVTRTGGVVAACVWDHAGGQGPLSEFWDAARVLEPEADDESGLPGARDGHLRELFEAARLDEVEDTTLTATVQYQAFEDWWEPYTFGIGPAGAFVAALSPDRRNELRERCRERLPSAPFTITARAWAARGLA
jgi:SAM-dependent methyltransferase